MSIRGSLVGVTILVALAAAALLTVKDSFDGAAALPDSAQARYIDMTVTMSDGKEISLPDRTVTCSLEFEISASEGFYVCPAPHDIDSLVSPAQVSGDPLAAAAALVEIDAASIFWGFSANTWQTVQINYGTTLSSANVLLGQELTGGDSGHIENTTWPDFTRGVSPSSFLYRAKANASGYLGTEWLARGTQ